MVRISLAYFLNLLGLKMDYLFSTVDVVGYAVFLAVNLVYDVRQACVNYLLSEQCLFCLLPVYEVLQVYTFVVLFF